MTVSTPTSVKLNTGFRSPFRVGVTPMIWRRRLANAGWAVIWLLASLGGRSAGLPAPAQLFVVAGVVCETKPEDKLVVIRHEAVSNYMAAMTMPFKVKSAEELAGVRRGDKIQFRLHVTGEESWVDGIVKMGADRSPEAPPPPPQAAATKPDCSLLDFHFTNELGQAVSLGDFRGQALAITFFYTRCPLPDYCPRLSKNFQLASQRLAARTNPPANWHFVSVSLDPEYDSPAALQAYGRSYDYDPAHWSFLTGPADKIAELARGSGVHYQAENGAISHDFRTLIINAHGDLQMVFPTSGDLSDSIVTEMIKAAAATTNGDGRP